MRAIGAANSHRSTIRPPINSSSPLAPKGSRRSIPISIAQESLYESDHRNHMSFLSKSSLRAESTKVAAARTAPSPSRGKAIVLCSHGLAAFRATLSSLTAHYRKSRARGALSAEHGTCAIKALRRSASRCHWSRLSMMRSINRKMEFFVARNRSSSMRNRFSSRRIIATGSDASGNCCAGVMRVKR